MPGASISTLLRTAARRLVAGGDTTQGDAEISTNGSIVPDEHLATLPDPFRSRLLSMYAGEPQIGEDSKPHRIDGSTRISPSQGMWMYDLCLALKPATTLEIGMAYGYSTLYILAAMAKNGAGIHTAIDPFQGSMWHGIGRTHARAAASSGDPWSVVFIQDRSDRASTDLARTGASFDIIFVDGSHRFDDVLVDFSLYAPLCASGGHMIFDDMWMSSVRTAVNFVRTNRSDFVEVPTKEPNISVFRKVDDDRRAWKHFRTFGVSRDSD